MTNSTEVVEVGHYRYKKYKKVSVLVGIGVECVGCGGYTYAPTFWSGGTVYPSLFRHTWHNF